MDGCRLCRCAAERGATRRSATNSTSNNFELHPLFSGREVFLRHDWLKSIVSITRPNLRHLKLFRPATIDLVLSKMMRGSDPQDMADAGFMIRHDRTTESQLLGAFAQMKPIALVELRDAFAKAKPIVLKIVHEVGPQC